MSASSRSTAPYEPAPTPPDEQQPPAKRQRTLACGRCRRRKQKCDEQRPCTNCTKSGEPCHEIAPRLATAIGTRITYSHAPLPSPIDVASLEERVARLEKAQLLGGQQQWSPQPQMQSSGRSFSTMPSPFPLASSPSAGIAAPASVYSCDGSSSGGTGRYTSPSQALRLSGLGGSSRPGSSSLSGTAAPAIGLLATFARPDSDQPQGGGWRPPGTTPLSESSHASPFNISSSNDGRSPPAIDRATEDALFAVYRAHIHPRYPFLDLSHLSDPMSRPSEPWVGFFVHMICSIGMLLSRHDEVSTRQRRQNFLYRMAVTRHLSHVFARPDRVLHVQAHLLLAVHALYSPSTERLIGVAGATMRYCVLAGLHREVDDGVTPDYGTQLRRRVFWSAYALDRAVGAAFDLPPSIPDGHIRTKLYDDEGDEDLATARQLVRGLRLQSEVVDARISRHVDDNREKEHRLLRELEQWGEACRQRFSSAGWLSVIYHASMAMLVGDDAPHNEEAEAAGCTSASTGVDDVDETCITVAMSPPASHGSEDADGDSVHDDSIHTTECGGPPKFRGNARAVRARNHAFQACLGFSRQLSSNSGDQSWLGLITQFKCGLALVYQAEHKTGPMEKGKLSEAIRACAATLAAMTERWPQSKCLRDVFEVLAVEQGLGGRNGTGKRKRGSKSDAGDDSQARAGWIPVGPENIRDMIPTLGSMVVHRPTLGMVRDMVGRMSPRAARSCSSLSTGSSMMAAEELIDPALKSETTPQAVNHCGRMEPLFSTDAGRPVTDKDKDHGAVRAVSPGLFLLDGPQIVDLPERDYRYDYLDLGGLDEGSVVF